MPPLNVVVTPSVSTLNTDFDITFTGIYSGTPLNNLYLSLLDRMGVKCDALGDGVKADDLKASQDSEWVLQSDRGLTYTNEVPKGSKVVEGEWWSADYSGPPLVSMEKKIADGLKLTIGDEIVVNVLGRDIPAKISNLRNIDWQGLGINFVLVFSPNAFKGAPHSHVATLSEVHPDPAGDARIIKQVADAFPMVTSVRVREALETVGAVVTNLVLAIRGASAVTLTRT